MKEQKIKLSVLDQSPVRRGATAEQALQETIQLARLTDKLGYTRYWVSEHHNTPGLAGPAPEVLIARLAAETQHLRLGSGGVMLPNHSTLKVAENFRLLEALSPGRIDLGIGRAPGGDRLTAHLLNPSNQFDPRAFVQQLTELQDFLTDTVTPDTVLEKVKAIPHAATVPALWMLTSSGESGVLAAHFGMALSFAHFINPRGGPEAVQSYRHRFQPSERLPEPQANVGIFAFCADTDEKVQELLAVMDHRILNLEKGLRDSAPTYAEIKDYPYTEPELQRIHFNRGRMIAGTPEQMKEKIEQLAARYEVDEVVLATITDDFQDRLRSYELLADVFDLKPAGVAQAV
ncbi:luciferase family oxidoreductase, group 1 [Catalinimonas alkaloidigena]|uniref:Luciferase-like monooxygenase n=1 Tax=Catalinimonas alkaloidigena TaxID=1075417 RepID=A0A1G9H5U1_9BACT|nr:LLM class flavin-dependent oxidoreductase [Catalinimonas alkaloidigena]SDL08232.1 luciferase family oxidoreductase, group 1 [Catalinimonas alkaloidigena]